MANDLATTADMEARLGITFTGPETTRAQALLDMAASLVRGHCKQHITKVTDDVLTVQGTFSDRLLLPERPVVSVSSIHATYITGASFTFDTSTYYVDRDEVCRYTFPLGSTGFFGPGVGFLGPGYKLDITYTHGFDPAANPKPYQLAIAQSVALDSAIRAYVNPAGLAQSEIGGVLETYPPGNGMLLNGEEKWNLNDAFRRYNQTITLR
jgi:hypothetical protein